MRTPRDAGYQRSLEVHQEIEALYPCIEQHGALSSPDDAGRSALASPSWTNSCIETRSDGLRARNQGRDDKTSGFHVV